MSRESEQRIACWLREDDERMAALRALAELALPDAWLAAGFVRNLVWDRLHGYSPPTPLNDLDVLHFDATDCSRASEQALEARLGARLARPWSVRNQARMHHRNGDPPYQDSIDAMRYWVELETAVAVRLVANDTLQIAAPFGLQSLLGGRLTPNPYRPRPQAFARRCADKGWLQRWPRLSKRSLREAVSPDDPLA
ncbi:nucleotidyltransferase family protein [Kushneria sinocarnis]|uniref:nucleotidyltransferase family protein n=1 Tax=Kushneria sinocarnis TaxID=595502 RepID=UPI001FE34867|nr:nucleotidyltransferase family protein [Kushneria sinocarnis]